MNMPGSRERGKHLAKPPRNLAYFGTLMQGSRLRSITKAIAVGSYSRRSYLELAWNFFAARDFSDEDVEAAI